MRRRTRGAEPTRPRRIHMTDAEWAAIGAAAGRHAVSRSRYVTDRIRRGPAEPVMPADILELVDEARIATGATNAVLEGAGRDLSAAELLSLLTHLARIDARLARAIDAVAGDHGPAGPDA